MISIPLLLCDFKSIHHQNFLIVLLSNSLPFFLASYSQPYKGTVQAMVDPLSVAGVVYPIARDLVDLVKKLKRVYKEVRYASKISEK